MKKIYLAFGVILFESNLHAQNPDAVNFTDTIISPQFFVTVIAGVILALGFQFILTALSVAAGITAVGDVKKSYVENKNNSSEKDRFNEETDDADDDSASAGTIITTGFGIWSTITVAISLFGATAFAMNLSLVANPLIAVTLALVIWASFFILLFYLESKVVNTVVGGLINTATAGLRSSASAVKDMFAPSDAAKVEHVADHTVEKVRKEFQNNFDAGMFDSAVDEFFTKFDKKTPNYDKVKQDIQQLVDESVKKSNEQSSSDSSGGQGKWMAIQSVLNSAIDKSSNDNSEEGKSKTEQLKRLESELKEAYGEGDTKEEKAKKVIAKLTPAEEAEVDSYMNKVKEFLSQDGSSAMDAEEMEQRIKEIIKNPKVEANKIGQKMGDLDRNTIVEYLSENTSMERQQIEMYADKAEKIIRRIQVQLNNNSSNDVVKEVEKRVQNIIGNLTGTDNSSGINTAQLSRIFQEKMDNQKDSLESIKARLANADREEVNALVTNNTNVDRKDIDKVVDSYEDARQQVLDKVQQIEDTARGKIKVMERKAVIQAEHARETAAAAAWWLVVSAVFSACAAIGGSLLTLF
ncbi:hypothetical protein SAMN05444483_11922 [Salegentibacter echinorum]|uniref:Uncharacterized protein n=1 Tax=Salegentibacter echinorum TaxID=1073325 RepID=A0A1M5LBY0_SALEC|nr:hypothetical protein [Salegentibacter echinorum]SHG62517.1 hypothetical protein SAMN05444483_11922 [Salegentibacter echinorum]